jgi:hypothetical protein
VGVGGWARNTARAVRMEDGAAEGLALAGPSNGVQR